MPKVTTVGSRTRPWTKREDEYLKTYAKIGVSRLREYYLRDRTVHAIRHRANRLSIKISNLSTRKIDRMYSLDTTWYPTCQWILDNPQDKNYPTYCGKDSKEKSSWCPEHYSICFRKGQIVYDE